MPLPIETPAPKASSLIKRFQQTIDSLDGNQSLPLPDLSLKQAAQQASQNRRSASAGTPQTQSPQLGSQNRSSWNSPSDSPKPNTSSRPQTVDFSIPRDPKPSTVRSNDLATAHHDFPHPLTPSHINDNQTRQTFPSSTQFNLELPMAPPIDQPSDLSRLSDLCKSDLAVQSPVNNSKTTHRLPSSSQPKIKAPISAEVSPAPRARKVTNHITAPTAASLAKMRDSQMSRSNSQNNGSNVKTGSVKAPIRPPTSNSPKNSSEQVIPKLGGSPKLSAANEQATGTANIRQVRTSSTAPKERAKMQQVRPSTPATSHALRRSVIAKTKVPPLPPALAQASLARTSSQPVKVPTRRVVTADSLQPSKLDPRSQSVGGTIPLKKPDQRPLQRARVASAATPISGIRKSPNLKSTGQASVKLSNVAQAASASINRSPDLKTSSLQNRLATTQHSRSTKSSKPATMSFPDSTSTQKNPKLKLKKEEGSAASPTNQLAVKETNPDHVAAELVSNPEPEINSLQVEEENILFKFDGPTEDRNRVVVSEEGQARTDHVEKEEKSFVPSQVTEGDEKIEQNLSDDSHLFRPQVDEMNDQKRVIGLIDSIVLQPTPIPTPTNEMTIEQINNTNGQSFEKHSNHLSLSGISLNSDDDQSKVDFDASTTTNTDAEE